MSLKDQRTWDPPDDTFTTTFTTRKGRVSIVQIKGWHTMLLRGKRDLDMHERPLTLVRITIEDTPGHLVFTRPLWLIVCGQRRHELSLSEIWDASRQRDDVEYFFRFGKQRLLMDAYQTPETAHEENWWTRVQLAYLQLWFARTEATMLPRPWERDLPRFRAQPDTSTSTGRSMPAPASAADAEDASTPSPAPEPPEQHSDVSAGASPSDVQRDCERILQQIGTPARPPKRRGNAPGRPQGRKMLLRKRVPIVKKSVLELHQEQHTQQQRAP